MNSIEQLMKKTERSLEKLLSSNEQEVEKLYAKLRKANEEISSLKLLLDLQNDNIKEMKHELSQSYLQISKLERQLENSHPDYIQIHSILALHPNKAFLKWCSFFQKLSIELPTEIHNELLTHICNWNSSSFVTLFQLYNDSPKMQRELIHYYWDYLSINSSDELQHLLFMATCHSIDNNLNIDLIKIHVENKLQPSLKKLFLRWLENDISEDELNTYLKDKFDLKEQLFKQSVNLKLKEESILKAMGYQIVGKSRKERWNILQLAIKKYGVTKVVSIIDANIRLRSTNSAQRKRYEYAIGEWNYDLKRIFENY